MEAKKPRKTAANAPLPAVIFGRTPDEYDLPILKQVLSIFSRQLVKYQRRTTILIRIATLEQEIPIEERDAMTQLLLRVSTLDSQAIIKWLAFGKEVTIAEVDDDASIRECSVCLDSLPTSAFSRIQLTAQCDHGVTMCEACMIEAIDLQLGDESSDWNALTCPLCPAILRQETVRKYASARPSLLIEQVDFKNRPLLASANSN